MNMRKNVGRTVTDDHCLIRENIRQSFLENRLKITETLAVLH